MDPKASVLPTTPQRLTKPQRLTQRLTERTQGRMELKTGERVKNIECRTNPRVKTAIIRTNRPHIAHPDKNTLTLKSRMISNPNMKAN